MAEFGSKMPKDRDVVKEKDAFNAYSRMNRLNNAHHIQYMKKEAARLTVRQMVGWLSTSLQNLTL